MVALIQYLPVFALVILANLKSRATQFAAYLILILVNVTLLFASVFYFLAHWMTRQPSLPESYATLVRFLSLWRINLAQMGLTLLLTALVSSAFLLLPLRKLLAHWLPIDPHSLLDCTALALTAYYVGLTLAQLMLLGGLDTLDRGVIAPAPLDLLVGGACLVILAALGVGWGTRRSLREVLKRLKLEGMSRQQWLLAAGLIVSFLVLDYAMAVIWSRLAPDSYAAVSKAMAGLFGDLTSPQKALAIALSAGIGEETLFRGALQPRFGIWFTSLAFALGHLQYGLSPALVEVFIISVVLGYVRQRYNMTTCIVVHAVYNFADLALSFLFP